MYKRIKQLRKSHNLSQTEVSKILETPLFLYSLYENGKKQIPLNLLSKLARFYNTSIDYIVGDTDEIKPYR